MAFPFTFKYSRSFNKELSTEEKSLLLKHIYDFIHRKAGKSIETMDHSLQYKMGLMWSKSSILRSAEKGVFTIANQDHKGRMIYEIFMYRLFSIAVIIGIGVWIASESFWGFVLCLIAIVGENYLINTIQHGTMLNEIKKDCEKLLNAKPD